MTTLVLFRVFHRCQSTLIYNTSHKISATQSLIKVVVYDYKSVYAQFIDVYLYSPSREKI